MGNSQRNGMPRRAFLLSSVGSAGLLLPGTLRSAMAAVPELLDDDKSRRLRIGYLVGSDRLSSFADLTHSACGLVDACNESVDREMCSELLRGPIVDAHRIAGGDPAFASKGARLRVHGMFHSDGARVDNLPGLDLYAHVRPYQSIPFHVWGVGGRGDQAGGSANEVCLPVAESDGLTVSFDISDTSSPGSDQLTPLSPAFCSDHVMIRFSTGRATGSPKLRRGLYFVSLSSSERSKPPSWRGREVEVTQIDACGDEERNGTQCSSILEPELSLLSPLSYVLLSIDYADAAAETSNQSGDA